MRLSAAGTRLARPDHPRWGRREPGLARLAHVLDVTELVVRLHERARTGGEEDCPVADVRHEALLTVRVRDPPLVVAATGRS